MKTLTFICAFVALLCGHAVAAGKPNVLLIMSDDLRDTVGCYGHPLAQTRPSPATPSTRSPTKSWPANTNSPSPP